METIVQPKMTALQARLSKKLTTSLENDFATLKARANDFRQHLAHNKLTILRTLSSYQSHATSEDEFQRIFECLDSLEDLRQYLTRRTGSVAVFFPLNMPIYALVLYAITPALIADTVYVRAPQRMTELMQALEPILKLERYFSNISIICASREVFVQEYVTTADVVIFTGKLSNAQNVMKKCKRDSLFLFNGWGCNPIVVGEDADLELAAQKTVQARLFSSGQDCAGPDTILVSRQNSTTFVDKLKSRLKDVSVGSYSNPETVVGPLTDEAQIRVISHIFLKSAEKIAYGGRIDYDSKTIHPTIIVTDLSTSMNFEELFAPVLYVCVYDDQAQLTRYFEHPSYTANEMYVSLFGQCTYVESLQKSIIVRDNVIFDIDRGNDEFGGYSMGASFVASNRKIVPKPILVPREIYDYLEPGSSGYKLSPSLQAKIGKQVRSFMLETFSSNLVFGFVFGSIARQQATGNSDINTMIVLTKIDEAQIKEYTAWLRHLHEKHQLTFKEGLSVIALTLDELETLCQQVDSKRKCKNASIPTEALAGVQCGVGGDKKLSVQYGRRLMPFSQAAQRRLPAGASSAVQIAESEQKVPDSVITNKNPSETSASDVSSPPSSVEDPKVVEKAPIERGNTSGSRKGRSRWMQALCRKWNNVRSSARSWSSTHAFLFQ